MSRMANPQGEEAPRAAQTDPRSRRKRTAATVYDHEFVQAFADALRDILRHERRIAA